MQGCFLVLVTIPTTLLCITAIPTLQFKFYTCLLYQNCTINRQSHVLSNLEIIVHALIKIILGFTSYNFNFCLVQLFPKLDSNWCDYLIMPYLLTHPCLKFHLQWFCISHTLCGQCYVHQIGTSNTTCMYALAGMLIHCTGMLTCT